MIEKIKIAYLIDTISTNKAGTEKQLLSIVEKLDKDKFETIVICLKKSKWLEHYSSKIKIICLEYRGLLKTNLPHCIANLVSIIKDNDIRILQTFFEDAMLVGYLACRFCDNKPVLIASRRDLGLGASEPWYHKIYRALFPILLQRFDGIAVNAHAIRKKLQASTRISPDRIMVIPNGLHFQENRQPTPDIFNSYPQALWVGVVANLNPVKRLDIFLRGVSYALDTAPGLNLRAMVLGEGRGLEELLCLAESLGIAERVHFLGAVENVADYLAHLDIGVLCSDREGLSNALLEYMASGLPVIATAVGGNVELVDEHNGIRIPVGDFTALGNALVALGGDGELRHRLGAASLNKARNSFAWDRVIPQWEGYYRSLLGIYRQ